MADVKKIATRDSYGTLVELGKVTDNVVVLDADLAAATKISSSKSAKANCCATETTLR